MTVPRADVHHERIWRSRWARQGLAEPLIHGLANPMFDHGSMHCWSGCSHRLRLTVESYRQNMKHSQIKSCKIYQDLSFLRLNAVRRAPASHRILSAKG